ncbi:MAG: DUF1343 domain-containing protein, partial [Bacteroidota bacterium]|nr:DUF1343 domain-containing protein [Bacteroidota bacterium]
MKKKALILFWLVFPFLQSVAQQKIIPGAERMDVYVPLLKGKTVAVFANQTSMVHNTHLVDTLMKRGIKVIKIFGPEHGFRGKADDGAKVENYIDKTTGVEVISLYGKHNKPTQQDLKGVDIMIFDIQDVGARFYTFISSLQYYIEAACENSKPLLILDRPNPNGFYVDGPVLDPGFKSFVGMQPVPIVYGMTVGEYAMMIAGEKWLNDESNKKYSYYQHAENSADTPFHFLIIKCLHYDHNSKYILPGKPSPNLPSIQSIYWYPSTCFFEGTVMSEGRGTDKPFQIFGHPAFSKNLISFIPKPREGAANPKFNGEVCYGWDISGTSGAVLKKIDNKIQLKWLIQAYKLFPDKENFFLKSAHFNQLAGNNILIQQIKDGISESEIRKSWEPALSNFKKIRKKYLLYKDF